MLKVDKLNFSYGRDQTLFDISFTLSKGEVLNVRGPFDSGKTTLIRNLMGFLTLSSGEIVIDGVDVSKMPVYARAEGGVAYVPQGRQIFPSLTVKENLQASIISNHGIPQFIYDYFPILYKMNNRVGGTLVLEQQQQLAIAKALVEDPEIIIIDESNSGNRPNTMEHIGNTLYNLSKHRSLSIVIVEESMEFMKNYCDSFLLLDRGRVTAKGSVDSFDLSL